eukprot:6183855-Pleurochrysis_carterae.AAC.2
MKPRSLIRSITSASSIVDARVRIFATRSYVYVVALPDRLATAPSASDKGTAADDGALAGDGAGAGLYDALAMESIVSRRARISSCLHLLDDAVFFAVGSCLCEIPGAAGG